MTGEQMHAASVAADLIHAEFKDAADSLIGSLINGDNKLAVTPELDILTCVTIAPAAYMPLLEAD